MPSERRLLPGQRRLPRRPQLPRHLLRKLRMRLRPWIGHPAEERGAEPAQRPRHLPHLRPRRRRPMRNSRLLRNLRRRYLRRSPA